ncbi:MAG: hypothetical protein LKF96_00460, partial [Treponema sp.]|nr:hypothetical protein [Treponema sp.]
ATLRVSAEIHIFLNFQAPGCQTSRQARCLMMIGGSGRNIPKLWDVTCKNFILIRFHLFILPIVVTVCMRMRLFF